MRHARQYAADVGHRLGRKLVEGRGLARLEVDDGHGMPGIGEHHGDAAAHASGAEAGDALAHYANPSRSIRCKPDRSRRPRPRLRNVRPVAMESSPQIALPMAAKARASGVATPASSP